MVRSIWLVCLLLVASVTAWAQPARPTVSVEQVQVRVRAVQHRLGQLVAQRSQLRRRYDQQLTAIDRLKKQKASWRRDRELNRAQADANDTAKRLTALDRSVRAAQRTLATARRAAVAAIDRELAAGATASRVVQLGKLRVLLAPPAPAPRKIIIPNGEIDPLADAEELERQAAAIAAVEKQLEAQRIGLDKQTRDLELVAALRSAHERAGELSTRDDDQPHRKAPRSSRADEASAGAPQADPAGGASSGDDSDTGTGDSFGGDKTGGLSSFESSVAVVLGEAIDRTTIEGMLRASRSGDPKQRAQAARRARDAVARRLEQLRRQRVLIEARARQLRNH